MPVQPFVPFTAEYDERKVLKSPDGTEAVRHDRGRVCRDRRGRMRYDFRDDDIGTTVAFLFDLTSDRFAVFDASSGERLDVNSDRTATRPESKVVPRRTTEDPSQGAEQFRLLGSDTLGDRVIEGLTAHGRRIRLANGSVTEVWHAASLPDFPIISTASGPSGREERRLSNVRIGEPDPELFTLLDTVGK